MKKKIAVFGSLTKDIFVLPRHNKKIIQEGKEYFALPYGGKVIAENIEEHFGGGASNVSIGLQRLGHNSIVCGAIGDDRIGENIISHLKNEGIETKYIQKIENKKSGFSIILNGYDGERTVIFTSQANKRFISYNFNILTEKKIDALYLCHLSSEKENIIFSGLENFLDENPKIIFAWNPGKERIEMGIEKNKKLLHRCNFLFMNSEEAKKFTNENIKENIVKKILNAGVENVIITDGGNGAFLYSKENTLFFSPEQQTKKDTLGAGDSFASGFFASFLHENDLQKCGKYASMNAASVVSHIGAQDGLLTQKRLYK